MAAPNTFPIYSRVADIQWGGNNTAANTARDGTGTVMTDFTADATNGGWCYSGRGMHTGTDVATAVIFFVNNGSANTTASNNAYIADFSSLANTVSQTVAQVPSVVATSHPWPLLLPPGFRILRTHGTAVASGIQMTFFGGKF